MLKRTKREIIEESVGQASEVAMELALQSLERDTDLLSGLEQTLSVSEKNAIMFATVSDFILEKIGYAVVNLSQINPLDLDKVLGKGSYLFEVVGIPFAIVKKSVLAKLQTKTTKPKKASKK